MRTTQRITEGRLLTLVYYPNKNYNQKEYGGLNRFYTKNATRCINVEPKYNRFVIYWSDLRVLTETLPTYRNVFSLTCWYFGRQIHRQALFKVELAPTHANSEVSIFQE